MDKIQDDVLKNMTENQGKEVVGLLASLVSEVREIRKTQNEHSAILNDHTKILNDHTKILNDHTNKLDLLINRTGDIANPVMVNDKRLTTVEKDVNELRGGIH